MGTVQGPHRPGVMDKNALVARLNKLFQIAPVKYKAKDGSGATAIVEHRVGKAAGVYTVAALMSKLGLEKEYADWATKERRKISDSALWEMVSRSNYNAIKEKMKRAVNSYRSWLIQSYANHPKPLEPLFAFVPVEEGIDGLYIQALVDAETEKLVVGEQSDVAIYSENLSFNTQKQYDQHEKAHRIGRALLSLPNVNKDIQHRIKSLLDGKIDNHLFLPHVEDGKKKDKGE